jgi:catechol 2,3-dioxygenase-like lactoylglutathione lyase family enzyme
MRRKNDRPGIWIGHVTRRVRNVKESAEFFATLGLRTVMAESQMAILELRGGTHLLLFADQAEYKSIPNDNFDLMVSDVEAFHGSLHSKGIRVSKMKHDRFHTYFEAADPDGTEWRINSDHTEGRPV